MANFNINNKAESVDVEFFGTVSESWWDKGISVDNVRNILNENKNKDVNILLNSLGGNFFDALTIHDILKLHKGKVSVKMIGANASASTIIAMAADEKPDISSNGLFLVHNVRSYSFDAETAKDKREAAEEMDRMDTLLANIFRKKTGKTEPEILSLMEEERWLSAEEAKEFGFVDNIFEPSGLENLKNQIIDINNSKLPKYSNTMSDTKKDTPDVQEKGFLNSLKEFFADKKMDISDETKQVFQNEVSELKNSIAAKDAKITELQNSVNQSSEKVTELQNSIDALKGKESELQAAISEKETALGNATAEIEELKTKLNKSGVTNTPKKEQDTDTNHEPDEWDKAFSEMKNEAI